MIGLIFIPFLFFIAINEELHIKRNKAKDDYIPPFSERYVPGEPFNNTRYLN